MFDIAVLGDVRIHLVRGKEKRSQAEGIGSLGETTNGNVSTIWGGAAMMRDALRMALAEAVTKLKPDVHSYDDRELQKSELPWGSQWDLEQLPRDGAKNRRYRLTEASQLGQRSLLPEFPKQLKDPKTIDSLDAIVINDLGGEFRRQPIIQPSLASLPSIIGTTVPVLAPESQDALVSPGQDGITESFSTLELTDHTVVPQSSTFAAQSSQGSAGESQVTVQGEKQDEWTVTTNSIASDGRPSDHRGQGQIEQSEFSKNLSALLYRFAERVKAKAVLGSTGPRKPSPTLLISVDSSLPSSDWSAQPCGFWHWLQSTAELHDHTVVVLDADKLRLDGLTISENASWERTSQDLVRELSTDPRFHLFRKFRHIVVLFGRTGALLASRDERGWQYDLYFEPNHEDTSYTDPRSGRVLGASSVLVASIVRSMTIDCEQANASGGDYSYDYLRRSIDSALLSGLRHINKLFQWGYGESLNECQRVLNASPFPQLVFAEAQTSAKATDSFTAFRVRVPSYRTPNWSVLGESCKNEFEDISRKIVRYGVNRVLNRSWDALETANDFVARLESVLPTKRDLSHESLQALLRDILSDTVDRGAYLGTRTKRVREAVKKCLFVQLDADCAESQRLFKELEGYFPVADISPARTYDRTQLTTAVNAFVTRSAREIRYLLQNDPVVVSPVLRVGKTPKDSEYDDRLVVVDHQEAEGIRSFQNLINAHLALVQRARDPEKRDPQIELERPLSLAVFGPPGSGKSYAVKKILQSEERQLEIEFLTFNLSQFSSTQQLEEPFSVITNSIAARKVPVVFFDEFDSDLDNDFLGWLPFFLSPMEDGVYRKSTVKDAILVFAGGTSTTFAEFSRSTRQRSDPQWADFSRAKGPDFVSRLSGHMNIMGINPVSTDDELFLVRRAILMRALFTKLLSLKDRDEVTIQSELLEALLSIPEYKHGGRSLRILLSQCIRHGRVSKSYIPSLSQLNMYVDGKTFLDVLNRADLAKRRVEVPQL